METTTLSGLMAFLRICGRLKLLERFRGQFYWRDYPQQPRHESVADHTFRCVMLLIAIEKQLAQPCDMLLTCKMMAIHDLAEAITGDPSPLGTDGVGAGSHAFDPKFAKQKADAENRAMRRILMTVPEPTRSELQVIWQKFDEGSSFEARLVHAIDKAEAAMQVLENVEPFGINPHHLEISSRLARRYVKVDPAIESLVEEILRLLRAMPAYTVGTKK